MDDQGRGLEVPGEGAGRPLAVVLGLVPGEAAVLPLGEPELLGRAVHAHQVEDAGVADQGLEPVGVAADPVDHEPAVRAARRGHAGSCQGTGYLPRAMVEPLHEVFVDLAGPVLADLVGELLAVAGRARGD